LLGIGGLIGGYVADHYGRRNVMILMIILIFIGIFEISSDLLGIPLFLNYFILIIKSLCIGLPFFMAVCVSQDIFQKEKMYSAAGVAVSFFFLGEGMGAVLAVQLLPLGSSIVFPILLGCMGIMGILVFFVAYTKETLPAKEELEWKDVIRDFFCIVSESGICVYRHTFKEEIKIEENLFAGGISGIVNMVQEMVKSEKKTKVIDQEDVKLLFENEENVTCILISRKNLKILREKLKDITHEIEVLYKDVFPTWEGNLDVFIPIGSIVKKYFGP
jgi:hypothetical protein